MKTKILTLPGYLGSGKGHWQTLWENEFNHIKRVEQQDWNNPVLAIWLETLNLTIQQTEGKCILVCHSLACALVAHWATRYDSSKVIGALLVCPADVDSEKHTPDILRNFSPMPTNKLPFQSIVVASSNDPYVSLQRATFFAKTWGSHFIDLGATGHINAESGLSSWAFGKQLVNELRE